MTDPLEHIAHYKIVHKLGQGGMGEVYRAIDERLGRSVALKLLPALRAGPENQARLVREAQAAGQLNHPGIVTVHDVGIWRDRVYLVMELVEGNRVSELALRGVPPAEALDLCLQAARALAVAHRRGILHRDIKPDNLMVTTDGRLKVLDFGLAKLRDEAAVATEPSVPPTAVDALVPTEASPSSRPSQPSLPPGIADTLISQSGPSHRVTPWPTPTGSSPLLTEADSLMGTPAYMSPEQASRKSVDARSEVYSLALVLYELVTGKRPLARDSLDATLEAAAAADIPLDELQAPRPIVRVLERALARDREARYPDMTAFADALARAQRDVGGRRRRIVALSAGVVGLAAAGGGAFLLLHRPARLPEFQVGSTSQLTTGKSCEEAPVFTPDGREVLYDGIIEGDYEIAAVEVGGAHAVRRLTHAPGWDLSPAVSPDGKLVAYVHFTEKEHELRVMGIEGDEHTPPRTIAPSRGFPSWTPDGGLIYGDENGIIWRVDLATDPRPREIARLPADHLVMSLAQYPDGELAIATHLRSSGSSMLTLYRVRPGGAAQEIADWHLLDTTRVQVDRDGDGLYYVSPDAGSNPSIHWRGKAGGTAVPLGPIAYDGASISPLGDHAVLSACRVHRSIGRLGANGFTVASIFAPFFPSSFAMLGDGSAILTTFNDENRPRLWRIYPDGHSVLVVDSPSSNAGISVDEKMIVWSAVEPAPPGIYARTLAPGKELRLTTNDSDAGPVFSNDGTLVFFGRTTDEGARVYSVPVTGGEPTAVSPTGMDTFSVSPVDDQLAVIVVEGVHRRLLVGTVGHLHELAVPEHKYTDVAFANDGMHLLLAIDNNTLVEVDLKHPEAPRPVWSSRVEVLDQIWPRGAGDPWVSISAYSGNLFLVDGTFR